MSKVPKSECGTENSFVCLHAYLVHHPISNPGSTAIHQPLTLCMLCMFSYKLVSSVYFLEQANMFTVYDKLTVGVVYIGA